MMDAEAKRSPVSLSSSSSPSDPHGTKFSVPKIGFRPEEAVT
jgi:hypothetical protein